MVPFSRYTVCPDFFFEKVVSSTGDSTHLKRVGVDFRGAKPLHENIATAPILGRVKKINEFGVGHALPHVAMLSLTPK